MGQSKTASRLLLLLMVAKRDHLPSMDVTPQSQVLVTQVRALPDHMVSGDILFVLLSSHLSHLSFLHRALNKQSIPELSGICALATSS